MTQNQIVLHPLFLMRLIHLMRENHVREAIDLAGKEIQAALEADATDDGEQDGDSGIVIVPTPKRMLALRLEPEPDDLTPPKGLTP